MKHLFLAAFAFLVACSVGLRLSQADVNADRPVLYWITDKNPARVEQVDAFHRWLVEHGHTTPDGGPAFELRLDTSNEDMTKKIIQSVSGVGSDVMDVFSGRDMRLLAEMGVIAAVDEPAAELGFGLDATYGVIEPEIVAGGRQYMYPCNVTVRTILVNPVAFEAVGQPQPPTRWTVEEFEAAGKAFTAAANPPGTPLAERRFFIDSVKMDVLWRSFGASLYNETGTGSGLDRGGYADALRCWKKWVYEDRILPTPDDAAAVATAQGYGGAALQLFGSGRYAMLTGGRYFLIQLRSFPSLRKVRAVELPHGGFPNTRVTTRGATVYAGSDHPDLAPLFLAYLASDAYNRLIVRDADGLPPNPRALETEAFLRPPEHPGEWGFHGPLAETAQTIGIGGSYTPFAQNSGVERDQAQFQQLYELGRVSLAEAVSRTHGAVERRIRATVDRKPALRPLFEERLRVQAAVDERRASSGPIPENWVFNAYFRALYGRTGRLGPAEPLPPEA